MIVTSHRGAGFLEPENTLRAIRRAIALGADQVEIDVQLTRDGRLVLMHDATVDRTTNGTGAVADLTLDEIRQLDAGQGEQVPTLDEVLTLTDGKITPQIELKGPGRDPLLYKLSTPWAEPTRWCLPHFSIRNCWKYNNSTSTFTLALYGVVSPPMWSLAHNSWEYKRCISGMNLLIAHLLRTLMSGAYSFARGTPIQQKRCNG